MAKIYGQALIESLEREIECYKKAAEERQERINRWETDEDDCFVSMHIESSGRRACEMKIAILKDGGCDWFPEFATLDGQLVNAYWCNTMYGEKLKAEMPDGSVVWTSSITDKGLARRGLKRVMCLRPAWVRYYASGKGILGAISGDYGTFPSDINYATGEKASDEPIAIKDR